MLHIAFSLIRPKGKWLSLEAGRYLTGRDAMFMMGFPLHRMSSDVVSESATWSQHVGVPKISKFEATVNMFQLPTWP